MSAIDERAEFERWAGDYGRIFRERAEMVRDLTAALAMAEAG